MSKSKWYNPATWGNNESVDKASIKFPKQFGNIFASLFGSVDIYDHNVETYLIEGYQKNDIVYSITNQIANAVGKAKWYLKDKNTGEKLDIKHFELFKQTATPIKNFTEVIQAGVTQLILTGNAYYHGEYGKGANRKVYSHVYVVPSSQMQIRGNQRGIQGYYPNATTGFKGLLKASDVLHLRNVNPVYNADDTSEWIHGQPTFRAAKESIKTYNDSKTAGLFFIDNKGAQKVIMLDPEATLTPDQEDRMKTTIRKRGQGVTNNANIPILEGVKGIMDISSDPKKALVLEQRLQAAQEICNAANFPSQLVGIKDATYQNANEAKKLFWENCVIPQLEKVKDGLNRWSINKYGDNVELCYDISHVDAIQDDKLTRFELISKGAGLLTINQALEMAGLPMYNWMSTPKNMDEYKEQLYVGFTQAVVQDTEELSPINGETEETQQEDE